MKKKTRKTKKAISERKFYYGNNITEVIVALCKEFRKRYPHATIGEGESYYLGLMDGVTIPETKLKKGV